MPQEQCDSLKKHESGGHKRKKKSVKDDRDRKLARSMQITKYTVSQSSTSSRNAADISDATNIPDTPTPHDISNTPRSADISRILHPVDIENAHTSLDHLYTAPDIYVAQSSPDQDIAVPNIVNAPTLTHNVALETTSTADITHHYCR